MPKMLHVPDYGFWGRLQVWKSSDAAALFSGYDPRFSAGTRLTSMDDIASVNTCQMFIQLLNGSGIRQLASAMNYFEASPVEFIQWAQSMDIEVAEELVEKVACYNQTYPDWKSQYEDLLQKLAKYGNSPEAILASIERKSAEELNPKSRSSLLKLLLVMATAKYGYGTVPGKKSAPGNILKTCESYGVSLSIDTIRDWLSIAESELGGLEKNSS